MTRNISRTVQSLFLAINVMKACALVPRTAARARAGARHLDEVE